MWGSGKVPRDNDCYEKNRHAYRNTNSHVTACCQYFPCRQLAGCIKFEYLVDPLLVHFHSHLHCLVSDLHS